MQKYQNTLTKRRAYLKEICKRHPSWKYRMLLYTFLMLLSISIILFTVFILIKHPLDLGGIFIFMCGALGFSCIPFFIACSVKNTAKYNCGFPYSSIANGILILQDDSLEFRHWRVGKQEPAAYSSPRAVYNEEDCFIYNIPISQIKELKIDETHVCHINGNGTVSQPEWATTSGKRKIITEKSFSFLLDFEENQIEEDLKNWFKAVKKSL